MRVTAVIRALNEGQHIGRLLSGLERQSRPVDEVVVVDSGSTDDTRDISQQHGAKIVEIPKREFSFGRSLNYGCDAATGDVLLIVSAHVYPVYDNYVENMVRPFEESRVSIVYGRQVGDERTKFSESRVMLKWFPESSIWDQGHPFSNNANAAVRRDVWAELRYDEELTGLEDLEFAKRVLAQGGRVSYVAEAPVVHVHEETWEIIRNRYRREAVAYRRIMDVEPMSAATAAWLGLVNASHDVVEAARRRALRRNLSGIFRFRYAQFYGAWEGFRNADRIDNELLRRFYYPDYRGDQRRPPEVGRRLDYQDLTAATNEVES